MTPETEISFSGKDVVGIHSHNDDPTVIIIRCDEWEIRRVIVNQGIYIYILYLGAFKRLCLDLNVLKPFK